MSERARAQRVFSYVSIDPGFQNLGMAIATVDLSGDHASPSLSIEGRAIKWLEKGTKWKPDLFIYGFLDRPDIKRILGEACIILVEDVTDWAKQRGQPYKEDTMAGLQMMVNCIQTRYTAKTRSIRPTEVCRCFSVGKLSYTERKKETVAQVGGWISLDPVGKTWTHKGIFSAEEPQRGGKVKLDDPADALRNLMRWALHEAGKGFVEVCGCGSGNPCSRLLSALTWIAIRRHAPSPSPRMPTFAEIQHQPQEPPSSSSGSL